MKETRVLMVDDNVDLITMIKEYFNHHAVNNIKIVLEAHNGEEGLELIESKTRSIWCHYIRSYYA